MWTKHLTKDQRQVIIAALRLALRQPQHVFLLCSAMLIQTEVHDIALELVPLLEGDSVDIDVHRELAPHIARTRDVLRV